MPPAHVPTQDEFAALEARVAALEGPPPGEGVQARRIADLCELFGVNTFSSLDEHNRWGSWPADYRPAAVVEALSWITNGSGFALRIREYHYASCAAMQAQWLPLVCAGLPGTRVSLCPGANATTADVPTMHSLAANAVNGVQWIEGLNEPNTDFGGGQVPVSQTMAIQNAVWSGGKATPRVMGASVVAGMPHPEGWITGYLGSSLDAHNAAMQLGNGHLYPPHSPDMPGDDCSLTAYVTGLQVAYPAPIALTEFHPTLFASDAASIRQHIAFLNGYARRDAPVPGFRASDDRDPYWLMLALFRAAKLGVDGLWWYALFDYGATYECGLFPINALNPRGSAAALRALCAVTGDRGDRHGFDPGKLDFIVTGQTGNCDHDLYQASDGRFFILLWNSQQAMGGPEVPVTVHFERAPASVAEFDVSRGETTPRQTVSGQDSITVALDGSCRVLVVGAAQGMP